MSELSRKFVQAASEKNDEEAKKYLKLVLRERLKQRINKVLDNEK